MESVQCGSCYRKFDDETTLQIHHQYEGCASSIPSQITADYVCPLCEQIYPDPLVLQIHINEEHDEFSAISNSNRHTNLEMQRRIDHNKAKQRLDGNHVTDEIIVDDGNCEDEDALIARLLQEQEDAESFAEFQNRYGGSKRSFRERAEWNLDNLYKKKMISKAKYDEYKRDLDVIIAQPIERRESRTTGLIPLISNLPMLNVFQRRLCKPSCDHVGATWLDQGWACGYKNFQMLLSSLRNDPKYSQHLFGQNYASEDIPSVTQLQRLIEKAWSAGFDSEGRAQFNGSIHNSTKWIGPTEIMACLAYLNIKTELYEFRQPKDVNKNLAYAFLFRWIKQYFEENNGNICHPLYLQHEGHSRTIIGFEQFTNQNIRLLIFDPSTSKLQIENFKSNPNKMAHLFRRNLNSFQKPVYQILVVRDVLEGEEKEMAKRIQSIRVPV